MSNEVFFPKTIILGLGKSGISCARFLASKGEPFAVADSRKIPPELDAFKREFPDRPLYLGAFDPVILPGVTCLIVSPGISLQEPFILQAIEKGVELIGDIELFARNATAPVIAITGSNAKSTVTTLVGHLLASIGLKVAVGGNLGVPALDLLNGERPDYFVLEISSFQLETTFSLAPQVATILNVSPDHMDRYTTFADYVSAKQRIYLKSVSQIINRQDQYTYPRKAGNVVSFGLDSPQEHQFGFVDQGGVGLSLGKTRLMPAADLLMKGQHNYLNALAALAICHAVGVPIVDILPALKNFPGLTHRCEFVAMRECVSWYNDSKGTNVGAAVAAIEGLGATIAGKLIWIAGGVGKNADFSPLRLPVKKYVRKAILIGQDAPCIAQALGKDVEIVQVESLEKAVESAREAAHPQDAVLLSPACASFDMFKNFEHRGDIFKKLVHC